MTNFEEFVRATVEAAVADMTAADASLKNVNPQDLRNGLARVVNYAFTAGANPSTFFSQKGVSIVTKKEHPDEIAARAAKASEERNHKLAEELYLLAAARASAYLNQPTMAKHAKQWDKNAARERRLADLTATK